MRDTRKEIEIEWEGINLRLEIYYVPEFKGSLDEPASDEVFEIEEIYLPNGSDAIEYFSKKALSDITAIADKQRKLTEWD